MPSTRYDVKVKFQPRRSGRGRWCHWGTYVIRGEADRAYQLARRLFPAALDIGMFVWTLADEPGQAPARLDKSG